MYDISSQRVNKLSGELSSAFVNVAEENANAQDIENVSISDSGIIEQMMAGQNPKTFENDQDENSASENFDSDSQASGIIEAFMKPPENFNQTENKVVINSGYSVITS